MVQGSEGLSLILLSASSNGTFGCKSAPYYICSICAYFSVARFVISGGYYRSSFESVIESIVR